MSKPTLILAYLMTAAAVIIKTAPPKPCNYPLAGVVVDVDYTADTVTFRTGSGLLYSLEGCEDWQPGDVIACTMSDNGTPEDATDDIITDYRYCGYVS